MLLLPLSVDHGQTFFQRRAGVPCQLLQTRIVTQFLGPLLAVPLRH